MPAQDADFRRVGEGLLEAIGEPVRHRIAEHHDRRLRDRVGLLGRGRLGIVRRRRAILPLGGIEPVRGDAVPAERTETGLRTAERRPAPARPPATPSPPPFPRRSGRAAASSRMTTSRITMPRAIAPASVINAPVAQGDATPAQPSPLRYFYHGEGVGLKVPGRRSRRSAFHRHMMPKCRKDSARALPAQIQGRINSGATAPACRRWQSHPARAPGKPGSS